MNGLSIGGSKKINFLFSFLKKHKRKIIALFLVLLVFLLLVKIFLPEPLFNTPVSLVVEDRNGEFLGAHIAKDGQWRFPYNQNIPEKFRLASICFEDKRFFSHWGIDVFSLGRAMKQNIRSGKTVSGGSTITMQVVRLARKKPRNIFQKIIEMMLSIYLELTHSKKEIFALYSWQAPFGGNVVGLDAAAWRYFGRKPEQLSWGEAAALAVLPNSPSLVHPGKNRKWLKTKRDYLLEKLRDKRIIDSLTCQISKLEPLPVKPLPLPQLATQLVNKIFFEKFDTVNSSTAKFTTTVDAQLQNQVNEILKRHSKNWKANNIQNAAVIVLEVESGDALAYIGNIFSERNKNDNEVDVIDAPRSPGSTLKPLLFAAMLTDGLITPNTLIPDIPTQVAGYAPKNFDLNYDGAVPARRALARSLNIPAIRNLRNYGVERFYSLLNRMGMTTLKKPANHYGLSLILGGSETTLWDLCGIYSSMARMLNHYRNNSGRYDKDDWHAPQFLKNNFLKKKKKILDLDEHFLLNAGSIWSTFEAMEEVMRPGEEAIWREFNFTQKIAWKTGTSFGFRDGWAIGITPKYVVGVWVGNADGEGRPGLTGISTAAPVMFEIFSLLPESGWFETPYDDLTKVSICSQSGYRALEICEEKDSLWIPNSCLKTSPCPYHQLIHLDASRKWRVNSDCESPANMIHQSWFVLPPAMEWYYKNNNQQYRVLPKFRADCNKNNFSENAMEIIYPKQVTTIYVPIEIDGRPGKTIFEVAHRNSSATIYWHLDEEYIGYTKNFHQMALYPFPGKHLLTLIDENGEKVEQRFEILKKE